MRYIFILLVFLPPLFSTAQTVYRPHIGGQLGLSFSVGTHYQRIGVMARLYYAHDFLQTNIQFLGHYNFQAIGSLEQGWEGQLQLGLVGAWGRRNNIVDIHPYIQPVGNQTARPYALGYAYSWFFDQMKTSQNSGVFGFQIRDFRFYFENDFLAFQSMDKYRSGAMAFFYRVGDWQFGLKNIAFTGDPYAHYSPWIEDNVFPSRSGFIDMTDAPYGNRSMGVLALSVEHRLNIGEMWGWSSRFPTQQYIGAEIGVDAEQIRNFFQNKLIHDSKILPINWGKVKNPHIPMLCKDGCPYTYHPGQELRKPLFYMQWALNNGLLY